MHELFLFAAGVIVGVMNSIAGGGMLIGFPALIALGLPPLIANATANVVTLPGQLTSAIGYRKYLRLVPLRYALLLIPVIVGAAAGALVLRHTQAEHFARIVPLLVLFGVILFAVQPLLHFHLHNHLRGRSKKLMPLILIGVATLPVSFYGGYFGAGYGFMMLAFLGFTNLHDAHKINAMKNLSSVGVAAASIACLYSSGLINWHYGLIAAAGSALGGYYGATIAQKVSSNHLRIIVTLIGIVAVIYLAFQEY